VIIAHRFAFAVMNGVHALAQARLLGHRCHNPLCQRIAPDHVVMSSAAQNRHEWAVQRRRPTASWPTRAARVGGLGNCATARLRTRS
jgi:hypothetical protein